jgi:TonB family protein
MNDRAPDVQMRAIRKRIRARGRLQNALRVLPRNCVLRRSMMRVLVCCLLMCLALSCVRAQVKDDESFARLEREVRAERAAWSGNKERLSGFFNQERKRLGNRFEQELLKYISRDAEKHYWISLFLTSSSYLHGNAPLPHLALLIKQQGIAMLVEKKDEESLGLTLGLSVTASVLAKQLRLHTLAISYKNKAEILLVEHETLSGYFPAMYEEEQDLYRKLESSVIRKGGPLSKEKDETEPKARVLGGILNSKVLTKVMPTYSAEARAAGAAGEVSVKVYFDESGKVIWAKAVHGNQLLYEAAEDATRRTTFHPTTVNGKPEKVMGILLFTFTP